MDFANDGVRLEQIRGAGDPMVVVRDALRSQLQQDRLRQDIIALELAKIERAIALRNASASPSLTPKSQAAAKKTAAIETTQPMKPSVQKPMSPSAWSCAVCKVQTTSERNLRDHCGGQKHQAKVEELEKRTKAMAGQKAKTTAKPKAHAARWSCSICQVTCTGEWDFDVHLKGQKHQANTQALLEQSKKKSSGNSEAHKAKLQASNVSNRAEKEAATWICLVCDAHCTCESDLANHLMGKRHQLNVQAMNTSDGRSSDCSSSRSVTSEMMNEQDALYFCTICSLKCSCEKMLADHLTGKKHLKQEADLLFCEFCKLQCNSEKMLVHHRTGKKHQAKLDKILQAKLNA
uniref:C2H2-type domain-containing protein n=1 Tax=Leersia perrieri TaxID=77586 RepID=A0A0D9XDU6_9ORYZ